MDQSVSNLRIDKVSNTNALFDLWGNRKIKNDSGKDEEAPCIHVEPSEAWVRQETRAYNRCIIGQGFFTTRGEASQRRAQLEIFDSNAQLYINTNEEKVNVYPEPDMNKKRIKSRAVIPQPYQPR